MFKSLRRRQSIPVCRRFEQRDGGFAGAAPATIAVAYFQNSSGDCTIGRNGAILVVSSDVASPADGVRPSGSRTPARRSARKLHGQFLAPSAPAA
jgi:hypothetical protein